MNPIFGAIAAGYTTKEIINFISNMFPGFSGKISQAVSSGYSPDEIIKFLKNLKKDDFKKVSNKGDKTYKYQLQEENDKPKSSMQKANALWYGDKEEFVPEQKKESSFLPNLGKAALGATALGAGVMASPMAKTALSRALPSLSPLLQGSQQALQMPQAPTGQQDNFLQNQVLPQQPPVNQVAPNIAQPAQPVQDKGINNPKEYLEKHGILDKVKDLLKRGNPPESVAAALGIKRSGEAKVDPELLANIEAYAQEAQNAPQEQPTMESQGEKLDVSQEAPKIEKSSIVSSPHGVGEVKEIRNGKAVIEVDGKKHRVDESELEPSSFSDDDIADAYDRLFEVIPEEHRSGFIQWAGYDENRNVLGYIPRSGKYEELHDITPEEAQMIKEGTGTARTTGETREGLWAQGEPTRGGIISQIIWDRKHRQQAAEEKQGKLAFDLPKKEKEDKGMKPLFDEMGYARELSRARDKRKKDEERIRKKREKDEAKKRKK